MCNFLCSYFNLITYSNKLNECEKMKQNKKLFKADGEIYLKLVIRKKYFIVL